MSSFAAEVKFHSDALLWNPSIAYDRALCADMTVGQSSAYGISEPYYYLESDIVQEQINIHGEY